MLVHQMVYLVAKYPTVLSDLSPLINQKSTNLTLHILKIILLHEIIYIYIVEFPALARGSFFNKSLSLGYRSGYP